MTVKVGAEVTYRGATGVVTNILTPPPDTRVELRPGYVRVRVKVTGAKGHYREGETSIWDVPDRG